MSQATLSVREMQEADIELITRYWLTADPAFLHGMGVDTSKMPSKENWLQMLSEQLRQSYPEKKSYCLIWLVDQEPVGHSNVNKIKFGEEAFMHLHLWKTDVRTRGFGELLVKKSLPYFFKNLQLKKLYCEPYALNPAPNKVLQKVGFSFVKEYQTTPGWINFEQPVKLWELTHEKFKHFTS
jgi:RimJ/RimL family protein N-acetyltransferase